MTRLRLAIAFSVLVLAFAVVDRVPDGFFAPGGSPSARGSDEDPVGAAHLFLDAVERRDCAAAFTLFSTATRENVLAEFATMVRENPRIVESLSVETLHCPVYERFASDTLALRTEEGDRAVVAVSYREPTDFLIPGFFPTSHRLVPSELVLVREGPGWRIERPAPANPGRREPGPG